jgi:hypothetical protein
MKFDEFLDKDELLAETEKRKSEHFEFGKNVIKLLEGAEKKKGLFFIITFRVIIMLGLTTIGYTLYLALIDSFTWKLICSTVLLIIIRRLWSMWFYKY